MHQGTWSPKKAEPIADKDQTGTDYIATTSQTAHPQREKKAAPQYTTHSDRVGKYRLWAGYKVKNKAEVVPNNIAVSTPM